MKEGVPLQAARRSWGRAPASSTADSHRGFLYRSSSEFRFHFYDT